MSPGSFMELVRAAKTGLLAMWGSAAWAQTQLTPGVSTLAAPPPLSTRACGGMNGSL